MAKFVDSQNREWVLSIDGFTLKRCRSELDVNLFAAFEPPTLMERCADPELFLNLLWILCEEQAVSRKIDEIHFAKGFLGKAILSAQDAFIEALLDFFQNDQLTEAVRLVTETTGRVQTMKMEHVVRKAKELRNSLINDSTNSPESVESSQTDEAQENSSGWPTRDCVATGTD